MAKGKKPKKKSRKPRRVDAQPSEGSKSSAVADDGVVDAIYDEEDSESASAEESDAQERDSAESEGAVANEEQRSSDAPAPKRAKAVPPAKAGSEKSGSSKGRKKEKNPVRPGDEDLVYAGGGGALVFIGVIFALLATAVVVGMIAG